MRLFVLADDEGGDVFAETESRELQESVRGEFSPGIAETPT